MTTTIHERKCAARWRPLCSWPSAVALLLLAPGAACLGEDAAEGRAAIGEPCITGDESFADFSGFSLGEVNIEGFGGSCGPDRVCLGSHFQGRVSCPVGQAADELGRCLTPEGEPISVPVLPQLESRPAERHVICSCRCDGPDRDADYCSCPRGMQCEELIRGRANGDEPYVGSYCTYPTPPEPLREPSEAPVSL